MEAPEQLSVKIIEFKSESKVPNYPGLFYVFLTPFNIE
jgi:hypothetical protein